jgi:hypothetical protein
MACGVSGAGPFCGCDGRKYIDPCYAAYEGVSVAGIDCSDGGVAPIPDAFR